MKSISRYLFVIFSSLIVFATSCNSPKHPEAIVILDSLQHIIEKTGEELKTINQKALDSSCRIIHQQLEYIQRNYHDTMSKAMGVLLSKYHALKTPFERLNKNYTALETQVNYTARQLKNLAHDLQHNLVDEAKIKDYMNSEKSEAERLINIISEIVQQVKEQTPTYHELQPVVEKMVDSLKTVVSKKL